MHKQTFGIRRSLSALGVVASVPLLGLGLSVAAVSPALAQEGSERKVLEEMIVTARKRDESIQEVPVAVTSITKELKQASVRRLDDIQTFSPNVYIRSSGTPSGASISIRGVFYQEIDKSFDPSIGVITDGMFHGTASGSLLQNFDIKRIEVLRGPQGTLFGKNTTGGVIKVTRGDVTMDWGMDTSVSFGDDGRQDLRLVANAPLIEDTLGIKVFAAQIKSDGWIRNTTLNKDVGGDDKEVFGFTTLWTPSDQFSAKLFYEHLKDKSDTGAWANFNQPEDLACGLEGVLWAIGCQASDLGSDKDNSSSNRQNLTDSEFDSAILTLEWELENFVLTSISSVRKQDEHNLSGFDSSPANLLYLDYFNDWDQFSQELQITSTFSDTFEFVAGLYYWNVDFSQRWNTGDLWFTLDRIGAIVPGAPGGAGFTADTLTWNGQNQETTSYAAFFSGDWHLNEKWTLSLGARWTQEEKDFEGAESVFYTDGQPEPGLSYTEFADDWQEFSPKIGFSYHHSDNIMIFGSYAEGFKSGGFFARQAGFMGINPSYDPEYVNNFELGMKSEWLDGRLIFNPTIFLTDYEDKQEELLIPISLSNVATVVRNASTQTIFGVELELQYQITDAWNIRASYGYLDSEYDDYVADLNGDFIETDNSNLRPRNTPENTVGFTTSYTKTIGAGDLVGFAALRWRDEVETIANNDPLGHMDAIKNVDLTLSYIWNDGRYRLTAYGRNVTDEREAVAVRIGGLTSWGIWNQGANYGVEFGVSI